MLHQFLSVEKVFSRIQSCSRGLVCMALVFTLAGTSMTASAQQSGPLDQVAVRPQPSRFIGPLDSQKITTQHSVTSNVHQGALDQLRPTVAATKIAQPRPIKTLRPAKQVGNSLPTFGTFEAYGFRELNDAPVITTDAKVQPSSLDIEEEDAVRPEFEEETAETPERPSFENDSVGSTGTDIFENSSQEAGPSTTNFSGTFSDFQAMTQQSIQQAMPGGPSTWTPEHMDEPGFQPTQMDYQAHGIVGYDDTLGSIDPTYVDGASFGFDRNRLYHPLETPTTQLAGAPTVPSGFGSCYCDEWEGFCRIRNVEYFTKCSGLKANPGHYGLPWLAGCDACEDVRPSFWQRIGATPRCSDDGCKLRKGSCGECREPASDCDCD